MPLRFLDILSGLPFHRFKGWYRSMGRMEMYRLKMLDDFKNNIKEIYKYFFPPIMDTDIQNRVLKKYIDGLYKREYSYEIKKKYG